MAALVWLMQERLLFYPPPAAPRPAPPEGWRLEEMRLPREAGIELAGVLLLPPVDRPPLVIYFGGNAEEVSWTLSDARWPRAWTIIGVNYRGYGASEGVPGEAALTSDALAIYDAAAKRPDIDPSRIVVFGRSLGTAIAAYFIASANASPMAFLSIGAAFCNSAT